MACALPLLHAVPANICTIFTFAAVAALIWFCHRWAVCAAASDNLRQKVWMSSTGGGGAAPYKLVVQEDGNAVIFDGSGASLWTTHTADAVVP